VKAVWFEGEFWCNAREATRARGIFYALAAGNDGANACNSSPARAGTSSGVMTVAATDKTDKETSWSNYGSCVDLWAPGESILSTRKGGRHDDDVGHFHGLAARGGRRRALPLDE
jgi:subtilisin family serine protease